MPWNWPNTLTWLRIFAIPLIALLFYMPYPWRYPAAGLLFAAAGITDSLDGYLARRLGQRNCDHVIRMYFVVGLDCSVIDSHKTLVNAALDLGACYIRKAVHQELVDPHQALLGISNNSVVLEE